MENKKAQLMSIAVLVLFLLMLAELVAFVVVSVGYDSIQQSTALAVSSTNYGSVLQQSASSFAVASGTAALNALFEFEYNSTLRDDSTINNFTEFMQDLIVNGTIPTVTSAKAAGIVAGFMNNVTFQSYNATLGQSIGIQGKNITVNETMPYVYQQGPYAIGISYTENIRINISGSYYFYSIPVNVSVSINDTPDLFYAEQGVIRYIHPATLNLTTLIGGAYATASNTLGFAYGTVYIISAGSNPCPSIPNPGSAIIFTADARKLSCGWPGSSTQFGGIITYNMSSNIASIPYLVYSPASGMINYLQNGTQVLLYGPEFSTYNIENLRNAVANGYYFTSPFAPSYIERAMGEYPAQSPQGIFTFAPLTGTQVGVFNALAPDYITATTKTKNYGLINIFAVGAWVYPTSTNGNRGIVGQAAGTADDWTLKISAACSGEYDIEIYGVGDYCFGPVTLNSWQYVSASYDHGAPLNVYINGQRVGTYMNSNPTLTSGPFYIGESYMDTSPIYFNGMLGNIQVYGNTLSGSQMQYLYQQGLDGVPVAQWDLVNWWPLNGNAGSLAGSLNNGTNYGVKWVTPPSYQEDAIFLSNGTSVPVAVPGLFGCVNVQSCSSAGAVKLYLSDMPLELSSSFDVANFSGISGQFITANYVSNTLFPAVGSKGQMSACVWYDIRSASGYQGVVSGASNGFEFDPTGSFIGFAMYNSGSSKMIAVANAMPVSAVVGNWINACFTYNSIGADYYLDGVQHVATYMSANGPAVAGTKRTVYIGSGGGTSGASSDVSVANLQIYNTTLTQQQVSQLYDEGITGLPFLGKTLVGYWPLDGNPDDYSGNSDNGTDTYVPYSLFTPGNSYNAPGLNGPGLAESEWQVIGLTKEAP